MKQLKMIMNVTRLKLNAHPDPVATAPGSHTWLKEKSQ